MEQFLAIMQEVERHEFLYCTDRHLAQRVIDYEWNELFENRSPLRYPALEEIALQTINEGFEAQSMGEEQRGPGECYNILISVHKAIQQEEENERVLKVLEDIIKESLSANRGKTSKKRKRKDPTYKNRANHPRKATTNIPQLVATLVAPNLSELNKMEQGKTT
jgi:hypothetical protein